MKQERIILTGIIILFYAIVCCAQTCVSTFNSIGIYWSPAAGDSLNTCTVKYRKSGQQSWNDALDLWYDSRDRQYRGSIVNLDPGTTYTIQLKLNSSASPLYITAKTWNETFPVSDTIYLPVNSTQTYTINKSGTASGYVLYTFTPGSTSTIDVANNHNYCINIPDNTDYIIIRGLTLRGAAVHGIRVGNYCNDVVIEKCDISNWGNSDASGWGIDYQSAIGSDYYSSCDIERLIVQCNKIHHPRTDANSWTEKRPVPPGADSAHPRGAQAISIFNSKGNHVIRYNDVYSDNNHYFNDIFGAGDNFSMRGFPNRDSDIYGNNIANCWDDGIESEGANMNVRIWGNYIRHTYTKIAITATSKGPLYIWKNIAGESRYSGTTSNSDMYGRGPFIKCGGKTINGTWYGGGRTYVFHNTVLQPKQSSGMSIPLGSEGGIVARSGVLYNMISRNNIYTSPRTWWGVIYFSNVTSSCSNNFNYDLYYGTLVNNCSSAPHEQNGINLVNNLPVYDAGNGPGEFALAVGADGYNDGTVISNFNDGFAGSAPDMGAFEAGSSAMKFGTENCSNPASGTESLTKQYSHMKVFPNPGNGCFTIELDKEMQLREILVCSLTGQVVLTVNPQDMDRNNLRIDMSNHVKGLYMLLVKTDTETISKKISLL